jgi:hypothetical protein
MLTDNRDVKENLTESVSKHLAWITDYNKVPSYKINMQKWMSYIPAMSKWNMKLKTRSQN